MSYTICNMFQRVEHSNLGSAACCCMCIVHRCHRYVNFSAIAAVACRVYVAYTLHPIAAVGMTALLHTVAAAILPLCHMKETESSTVHFEW